MKAILKLTGLLIAGLVFVGQAQAAGVVGMNVIQGSKHNFETNWIGTGVGDKGAITMCSTCHEMHRPVKMKPLWARYNPDALATWKVKSGTLPQSMATMVSTATLIPADAFVDSRSGLCLSCHDGSMAIGSGGSLPINSRANLINGGTPGDLSKNHRIGNEMLPVSTYNAETFIDTIVKAGDAVTYGTGPTAVTRYYVGCTSCHSMHKSPAGMPKLLVYNRDTAHGTNGPVCWDCHYGK